MVFAKWQVKFVIFIFKLSLAGFIINGLGSFLRLYNNEGEYIWALIQLIFIVGTLVLSIQPSYLKKVQEKQLPKNGFLMISSGIIILVSYGMGFTNTSMTLTLDDIKNISNVVFFIGTLLFCYSLSDLVIELSQNIFSKK